VDGTPAHQGLAGLSGMVYRDTDFQIRTLFRRGWKALPSTGQDRLGWRNARLGIDDMNQWGAAKTDEIGGTYHLRPDGGTTHFGVKRKYCRKLSTSPS